MSPVTSSNTDAHTPLPPPRASMKKRAVQCAVRGDVVQSSGAFPGCVRGESTAAPTPHGRAVGVALQCSGAVRLNPPTSSTSPRPSLEQHGLGGVVQHGEWLQFAV
ncbi:hypothetical protein VPH35_129340 [Triticum aestivum]